MAHPRQSSAHKEDHRQARASHRPTGGALVFDCEEPIAKLASQAPPEVDVKRAVQFGAQGPAPTPPQPVPGV